jgi:SepF-like predicted cell division protein (DUF552 family)
VKIKKERLPNKLQLQKDFSEHNLRIKNISVHDLLQVSKMKDNFLHKEPVILITKLPKKNLHEETAFINEMYSEATKNNYSVFCLGEQRIIATPNTVQVDDEVL